MKHVKDTETYGSFLRQMRKSQGVTREQRAAACGLGRRCIVELKGGKGTSHRGTALDVLAALGIGLYGADRNGDL